jgi:hypothetical protein
VWRSLAVGICPTLSRSVFATTSSGSQCLPACSPHGLRRKGVFCNSRRRFFMRRCIWSDDKRLLNVERTGVSEERRRPVSGSVPLIACRETSEGQPAILPRFETSTFRLRNRIANHAVGTANSLRRFCYPPHSSFYRPV